MIARRAVGGKGAIGIVKDSISLQQFRIATTGIACSALLQASGTLRT
jgi:hypothetical protein